MKKLLALFILCSGLGFAQSPKAVFGDLNVGGGHLNPGVGVSFPLVGDLSVPVEVSKSPGETSLTGGIEYTFFHINKDSVSGSFSVGGSFGHGPKFASEYAGAYNKTLNEKWTLSPYLKYSSIGGLGGWSAGASFSYKLK
jgi:hypothetical protein